jgi:predicted DNA-binding transcriptional regulator
MSVSNLNNKEWGIVMSILKRSILSLIAAGMIMGLVACEKEGPMEKAGKAVDESVEKAEKAIKEKTE